MIIHPTLRGISMKLRTLVFALVILVSYSSGHVPDLLAQSLLESASLRVFDSNDKLVGRVISIQGFSTAGANAVVPYRSNGALYNLSIGKTAISSGLMVFTTNNCTGTPYLEEVGSLFPPSAIMGSSLYVADINSPTQTITIASIGGFTGTSNYCSGKFRTQR
jgi:hypothetical protein